MKLGGNCAEPVILVMDVPGATEQLAETTDWHQE